MLPPPGSWQVSRLRVHYGWQEIYGDKRCGEAEFFA